MVVGRSGGQEVGAPGSAVALVSRLHTKLPLTLWLLSFRCHYSFLLNPQSVRLFARYIYISNYFLGTSSITEAAKCELNVAGDIII